MKLPVMLAEGRLPGETGEQRIGGQIPQFTGAPQQAMVGESLQKLGAGVYDAATTALKLVKDSRDQSAINGGIGDQAPKLHKKALDLMGDPDLEGRESKLTAYKEELKNEAVKKHGMSSRAEALFAHQLDGKYETLAFGLRTATRTDQIENAKAAADKANDADTDLYLQATRPEIRKIYADSITKRWNDMRDAGTITAADASKRIKSSLERAEALRVERLIFKTPGSAIALANNREETPNLGPITRQELINKAQNRAEHLSLQAKAETREEANAITRTRDRGVPVTPQLQGDYEKTLARMRAMGDGKAADRFERDWNNANVVDDATHKFKIPELKTMLWGSVPIGTTPAREITDPTVQQVKTNLERLRESGNWRAALDVEDRLQKRMVFEGQQLQIEERRWLAAREKGEVYPGFKEFAEKTEGYAGKAVRRYLEQRDADYDLVGKAKTPDELKAAIAEIEKRRSGREQGELTAEEKTLQGVALQALDRMHTEFKGDMAATAMKYNSAVRDAWAGWQGKRDKSKETLDESMRSDAEWRRDQFQKYVAGVSAEQARQGFLPHDWKLIPKQLAEEWTAQLAKMGNPEEKQAFIVSLRTMAGEHWERVKAELNHGKAIGPQEEALSAIPLNAKVALADVTAAYKVDRDKARELIGKQAEQVDGEIMRNGKDMFDSLAKSGSSDMASSMQRAAEQVAYLYVRQGKAPPEAARIAYDRVLGSYYEMYGSVRIRKDVDSGQPFVSPHRVGQVQNIVINSIKDGDLLIPPRSEAERGIPDKERARIYTDAAKTKAYWVTTADDMGMVLMWGPRRPVQWKSGLNVTARLDRPIPPAMERGEQFLRPDLLNPFGTTY